jgi:hypothetical protein
MSPTYSWEYPTYMLCIFWSLSVFSHSLSSLVPGILTSICCCSKVYVLVSSMHVTMIISIVDLHFSQDSNRLCACNYVYMALCKAFQCILERVLFTRRNYEFDTYRHNREFGSSRAFKSCYGSRDTFGENFSLLRWLFCPKQRNFDR